MKYFKEAFIVLCILAFIAGFMYPKRNRDSEITVGETRVIHWGNKDNPFDDKGVDTVVVTGVSNGYTQWQYKQGHRQNTKTRYFLELTTTVKE